MKADHRKELHTNLLADRMGRLVQGMRSGPKSTSAVVWVIAILTLATLIGWYVARWRSADQAEAWVRLDDPDSHSRKTSEHIAMQIAILEQIAQDYRGTVPALTARFQKARILLRRGMERLYVPSVRASTIEDLEAARTLYRTLISESAGKDILEQEALMGAAQAEEALVGVPKKDNPEQHLGDLDEAVELYQRLARTHGNSYLGQVAAKHAEDLKKDMKGVKDFYENLNKIASQKPALGPERSPGRSVDQ